MSIMTNVNLTTPIAINSTSSFYPIVELKQQFNYEQANKGLLPLLFKDEDSYNKLIQQPIDVNTLNQTLFHKSLELLHEQQIANKKLFDDIVAEQSTPIYKVVNNVTLKVCSDILKLPEYKRCSEMKKLEDCQSDDGLIDYMRLFICAFDTEKLAFPIALSVSSIYCFCLLPTG